MLSILYFMLLRVIRREVRATKDGEPKSFQHSKPEKDYSLCPIPVLLPLRFIFPRCLYRYAGQPRPIH